jgi:hypothetical protein
MLARGGLADADIEIVDRSPAMSSTLPTDIVTCRLGTSGTVRLLRGSTGLAGRPNEPVAGVRVLLDGPVQQRAESNRNGEFKFARLPAGDYTLTAEPPAGRLDLLPIPARTLTLQHARARRSVDDHVGRRITMRLSAVSSSCRAC